jgi:hypothetical protein
LVLHPAVANVTAVSTSAQVNSLAPANAREDRIHLTTSPPHQY